MEENMTTRQANARPVASNFYTLRRKSESQLVYLMEPASSDSSYYWTEGVMNAIKLTRLEALEAFYSRVQSYIPRKGTVSNPGLEVVHVRFVPAFAAVEEVTAID